MNELDFIQTVKIQGQCYLLNGTMSVPKSDGNREYELIKQWLAEGNIPEQEFTTEQLNAQRISQIKAKANELILARYSIIWQLNHPRTDITYASNYEFIDNIRRISNESEADGIALEDINWEATNG